MIINQLNLQQINIALLEIEHKIKNSSNDSYIKEIQNNINSIRASLNETKIGLTNGATYNINISGNASTSNYANSSGNSETSNNAITSTNASNYVSNGTIDNRFNAIEKCSLEETVIGKGINDETRYRRMFSLPSANDNTVITTELNDTNCVIYNVSGSFKYNGTSRTFPNFKSSEQICPFMDNTKIYLSSDINVTDLIVVIEYTKIN